MKKKYISILLVGVFLAGIILLPTMYTILLSRNTESSISLIKVLIPDMNFYEIFGHIFLN